MMMRDLRAYTTARVSLGRSGDSLPTRPLLDLRAAHAQARDAMLWPLSFEHLHQQLTDRGWPSVTVASQAKAREEYLRRPDLGRRLDPSTTLPRNSESATAFLIGDGLSALAIERHALPLLEEVFKTLPHQPTEQNPIVLIRHARVAIGDEIGAQLGAALTVHLIGERPGLSSPDSLGVYLTWRPQPGRTDADRNCLSNIHPAGLSYSLAAHKLVFLIHEMYRRQLSGVALKETAGNLLGP